MLSLRPGGAHRSAAVRQSVVHSSGVPVHALLTVVHALLTVVHAQASSVSPQTVVPVHSPDGEQRPLGRICLDKGRGF